MAKNDEYIKARLIQWSMWVLQREGGGLGFPRECSYTRMQARSGSVGFSSPEVDMDAMEMEQAVCALPEYLRDTVRQFYVAPGTIDQKARALGCHRTRVYARIEVAHGMILIWLNSSRKKTFDTALHNRV